MHTDSLRIDTIQDYDERLILGIRIWKLSYFKYFLKLHDRCHFDFREC